MTDQTITKNTTEKMWELRDHTGKRWDVIRRTLCWLSVCLMFISVVSSVVYAQQFFRSETCGKCRGTGRNLCPRCLGKGCQECQFSGVKSIGDARMLQFCGVINEYACCICKGTGKIKIDTRFEKCSRQLFGDYFGNKMTAVGDIGYLCPDDHPMGKIVIMDDFDKGNILRKYSAAD